METDILLGVLVRLIPAIAVCGLAFFAASDRKTRERWGDLLYQVGSIRPDQREDPKIGKGVKWPFFVVALGLLWWPIQYSIHATRKIEVVESDLKTTTAPPSDLKKAPGANTPATNPAAAPQPGVTVVSTPAPAPVGDLKPAPATPLG